MGWLSWCIKDLWGTKVMYCYVVKWPVFSLQRGSGKWPIAPSNFSSLWFIVLGIYNLIFSCSLRWLLTILYWSQWTDVELQLQRCQWITVVQCRLLHLCQDGKELLRNSIFRLHRCRYIFLEFSYKKCCDDEHGEAENR